MDKTGPTYGDLWPKRKQTPTQTCLGKKENILALLVRKFRFSGKDKSRTTKDTVRALFSELSLPCNGLILSKLQNTSSMLPGNMARGKPKISGSKLSNFSEKSISLYQWFLKCGLQIPGEPPHGIFRNPQGQNYFHNNTKALFSCFTVLIFALMMQMQCWLKLLVPQPEAPNHTNKSFIYCHMVAVRKKILKPLLLKNAIDETVKVTAFIKSQLLSI